MVKNKSKQRPELAALDRSPSHLLHRALQIALDIYAEELGPGAVTQRQYAVLAAAAVNDGAAQTDLVRITGIDRSTLADMVARMISKGLLERERSNIDARANAVRLSEAGRAVLAQAEPRMAAADARLLKLLRGGGRRTAFLALLQDLIGADEPAPKAEKPPKPEKSKSKKKKKKERRAEKSSPVAPAQAETLAVEPDVAPDTQLGSPGSR